MDLSKIPTEDLQAIQAGHWDKVSTPGLQEYQSQRQHLVQAQQQAQNPQAQTVPDAADKASRPSQQYLSPGESATNNYWTNVKARITDPSRYQAIANNSGPAAKEGVVGDLGAAGLTIPMESAPAALQGLSSYLGKSGIGPSLGRIAANAGIGGIQGGAQGALVGGGLGAAGEAVGGLIGAGKNLYETGRMALNPARTQDIALDAIEDATGKLKSSEAENLQKFLGGKSISIEDPSRYLGINPEADILLNKYINPDMPSGAPEAAGPSEAMSSPTTPNQDPLAYEYKNAGLSLPNKEAAIGPEQARAANPELLAYEKAQSGLGNKSVSIPAEDANKIRSLFDSEMTYKKLGPFAQTAETAARDSKIKPLADELRGQIHELSPDVSHTLDQWSDNLNAARNLDKRAETAPMTVLSSPSFDRRALLQKVDDQVGTGLQDLGSQITNAKDLSNAFHNGGVHPIDAALTLTRSGVQGGLKGNKTALPLEALGQGLFSNSQGQ